MDRHDPEGSRRLLFVDDNEDILQICTIRFERYGFEVDTLSESTEVLAFLERYSHDIDVVFLDQMMPRMTGLEVLEKIRARYSEEELPVFMLSAKSEASDVEAALERGANGYIFKPINFRAAHETLRQLWVEEAASEE